jgi:hypothetical protein
MEGLMTNLELGPLILRLAARECGVASDDSALSDFKVTQVGQRANQLVKQGLLHVARFSYRSVRWYTSAERARKAEENNRKTKIFGGTIGARKPERHDFGDGEVRYSKHFKGIQYCPSHVPQFSEITLGHVYGGNQRGRVLVSEVVEAQEHSTPPTEPQS